MSKLAQIEDFAQQVAEAISAVVQLEVAMIDETLRLCVGTGVYRNKRNMVFDPNSASGVVVRRGRPVFIRYPREDSICQGCGHRLECPDLADLCYPIIVDGETVGNIALVALTEQQQQSLLGNEYKLLPFLEKMAGLIAHAIHATMMTQRVSGLKEQLEAVVNSINEGILYLSRQGKVMYANRSAAILLGTDLHNLAGKPVEQLFTGGRRILEVLTNQHPVEIELFAAGTGGRLQLYGTVTPLICRGQEPGLVISFRDMTVVPQMVRNFISKERRFTFHDIQGTSPALTAVKHKAMQIARGDSSVVILGESGTGKELFARAIHFASPKAKGPFISINCGAIPEGLLESELFGYEEGAFTGARKGGKLGRFELANNGTLFLDEVGDMPLHLQVKFLRVLEEKQVDRVGGTHPITVNARIIAATNKNLEEMVKRGEFREDLYYRLNVIPLRIPPLRERQEDIRVYLDYFLGKYNRMLSKDICGLTSSALNALMTYSWPGNVRELENIVEYAMNIATRPVIDLADLPERFSEKENRIELGGIEEAERKLIEEALKRFGTDTRAKEKAAKYLGISRSTLYRKLKRYHQNR